MIYALPSDGIIHIVNQLSSINYIFRQEVLI